MRQMSTKIITSLDTTISKHLRLERTYICQHCSKSFKKPSSLRSHSYTHTGEKPFACYFVGCNRRFSVVGNLRRHLKVHRPKPPASGQRRPIAPYPTTMMNYALIAPLPTDGTITTTITQPCIASIKDDSIHPPENAITTVSPASALSLASNYYCNDIHSTNSSNINNARVIHPESCFDPSFYFTQFLDFSLYPIDLYNLL